MHSNVVGYKAEGLQGNDYSMVGIQFATVADSGLDINVDAQFTGVVGDVWPDSDTCDFIEVYVNGEGWKPFYYNTDNNRWQSAADEVSTFAQIFPNGVPVGTTMWYNANPSAERSEALNITISGAVKPSASVTIAGVLGNDYSMISNPYPNAYDINDGDAVAFTGIAGDVWPDSDTCDFIEVYVNGEGWKPFYYNTDNNRWQSAADEVSTFAQIFPNGCTSSWWLNANPGVDRVGTLGVTFYSPIAE